MSYNYRIIEEGKAAAVIELHKQVLGGEDALDFASAIDGAAGENVERIIVDMNPVQTINSSGLGMLIGAVNSLKKRDKKIVFANVPEKVMGLLDMTRLSTVFLIAESIEKALEK